MGDGGRRTEGGGRRLEDGRGEERGLTTAITPYSFTGASHHRAAVRPFRCNSAIRTSASVFKKFRGFFPSDLFTCLFFVRGVGR
jgi:hypothetical protein